MFHQKDECSKILVVPGHLMLVPFFPKIMFLFFDVKINYNVVNDSVKPLVYHSLLLRQIP